jgi:release factor glutamine methyltransferase
MLLAKSLCVSEPDALTESATLHRDARARLEELVARRIAREPLAYIVGHREFWSLDFEVGPGVLVPRPESETLIETLLEEFDDRAAPLEILDCGTGSGCLVIAALSMFPNARGTGIDASCAALPWAERNVARHNLGNRCALRCQDWTSEIVVMADAILANPPYVKRDALVALPPEVARYEPAAALCGGEDGLDAYRALAPRIAEVLKPDGVAILEIGEGQGNDVRKILADAGLETGRIAADLAGIPRCVVARLSKRAAK